MSKELEKTKKNDATFSDADKEAMAMMDHDAEGYVDEVDTADCEIPRTNLLQPSSPQILKGNPDHIKGAESGDFLKSLANTVIKGDEGFHFVPVKRQIVYIEWIDRKKGGGMVNHFGKDSTVYDAANVNENGQHLGETDDSEIVKTYEVYGYIFDPKTKELSETLLSFKKSAVRKMKKWNTLMRSLCNSQGKQLPIHAGVYKIKSIPESNKKGDFFNYEITPGGFTLAVPGIGKMMYEKAKSFSSLERLEKASQENPNKERKTAVADCGDTI